jgi:hypothetical protein
MRTKRLLSIALCLSALPACGPGALVPETTEPPSTTGSAANIDQQVGWGSGLALVRGQNLVALELDRRHEATEALDVVERARVQAERLSSRAGGRAQSSFARLKRALQDAADALERPDPARDLDQALGAAGRATLQIESDLVGSTRDTTAYRASVVAALVNVDCPFAYEAAIELDRADLLSNYRLAYGCLREAANLHAGLSTLLEENTDDRARATEVMLASMFKAMPEAVPPEDLAPLDDVRAAAYMLGALLAEQYGALAPPPADRLGFISPLLEEVLTTYESGEAGVADVLLEQVRADLCCPQTSAGTPLEDELGALSQAIRSGAADDEIAALVEEAADLAEAAAG